MKPYYQDDFATIFCMDSRDFFSNAQKCFRVDAVITDPPYGVDLGNHADATEKRVGVGLKKQAYESYNDTHDNLKEIVVPVITSAIASSKRAIVFMADTHMWDFPRPDAVSCVYIPNGNGRTKWGFQNVAHFMAYGTAPNLNLGAKHTALYSTETSEKNGHPCPKPIGWMRWAVSLASIEGEIILDPFMGSGTTLVAAKQLGRKSIGIEISEEYCRIVVKRLQQEYLPLNTAPTPKLAEVNLL